MTKGGMVPEGVDKCQCEGSTCVTEGRLQLLQVQHGEGIQGAIPRSGKVGCLVQKNY